MANESRATTHLWGVIQAWLDELPYPPRQALLAKRLGVVRQTITDWKYGDAIPTWEHLEVLADEMSPVAGPDIHERLWAAVNRDRGYKPRGRAMHKGSGKSAAFMDLLVDEVVPEVEVPPAAIESPTQPARRRRSQAERHERERVLRRFRDGRIDEAERDRQLAELDEKWSAAVEPGRRAGSSEG